MVNAVEAFDAKHMKPAEEIPAFRPGDTVDVNVKIQEGNNSRIQTFTGVVIARKGAGVRETFVVRKISFGTGVERRFKGYSHLLVLDVVHCGGKPGTLYRLTEDALIKDDKQRLSIHDIDLIDSLRMAEKLFGTKSELLVLGVEPKDYVTWNIGLSDDVRAVFPEFLALARKEIGEWLKRYGNEETRA